MGVPKIQKEAKVIRLFFTTPNQQEIIEYINSKMKWPMPFCAFYGEKFFNYYESIDWMVGRHKMKNWKAAFNSQWQTIKFQEDEKKLIQCLRKEESDKKNDISEKGEIMDKTVIYLNYILSQYQRHPTWIDNSQLIPIYDHLKAEKAIKLNSDEVEICKQMGPEKGKAQAVKFLFDRMIKENRRFI